MGGICGISEGGASLSQGIGAGCSARSTYKGDDMYTSERQTGTSNVALTALSSLKVANYVSNPIFSSESWSAYVILS